MLSAGLAYLAVSSLGFSWVSLSILMYLYVAMGAIIAVAGSVELEETGLADLIDRVVLVAEGEELVLRKLASGEKYRVEGELEKL